MTDLGELLYEDKAALEAFLSPIREYFKDRDPREAKPTHVLRKKKNDQSSSDKSKA